MSRAEAAGNAPAVYALCAGDTIAVQVFREPDLSVEAKIEGDGTIRYPLLGSLKVQGLSVDQAASKIAALLNKDYVIDPQVSILVTQSKKRQFSIIGQVKRPGYYDLPEDQKLDLINAIALAGGFTTQANPSRVRVSRGLGDSTETLRVNVNQMLHVPKTPRVLIVPNDSITVEDAFQQKP